MKVNEKIRSLREARNWSQEEMANKLGMSTNGYSKIERGETRLYIPKLEQIADAFDIDVLELMSMGEKNVIMYHQESNNSNFNIISDSSELTQQIEFLKLQLDHKNELIKAKDEIIEMQRRENALLREALEKNKL
ncbi:helix-turn-helix domain-containing protein [Gallibacterium anatis]|uniref:helix-turn-helix domain-containing protein n=1 Tax=Gallibacterium anatis TaxID=750 RepID=UPI0039FD4372